MNKTYCCSDLHGMYNLWKQIKNYLDESDTLYFLGDAVDRGDYGISIVMEMLADKRVHYLMGNHEDFLIRGAEDMMREHYDSINLKLWASNGGEPTMTLFDMLSEEKKHYLLRELKALPREATYANKSGQEIFMCHAGTSPDMTERDWLRWGVRDGYLWNRDHFFDVWPEDEEYKNKFIVHGHTPTLHLEYELNILPEKVEDEAPTVVRYADGHKFDVDLGCFFLHRAALLDLDSFEVIYFEDKTKKEITV